jgi:hypothetical protein
VVFISTLTAALCREIWSKQPPQGLSRFSSFFTTANNYPLTTMAVEIIRASSTEQSSLQTFLASVFDQQSVTVKVQEFLYAQDE